MVLFCWTPRKLFNIVKIEKNKFWIIQPINQYLYPARNMLQMVANFLGCWGMAAEIEGWVEVTDDLDIGEIILRPFFKVLVIFSPGSPFHRNGYPSP